MEVVVEGGWRGPKPSPPAARPPAPHFPERRTRDGQHTRPSIPSPSIFSEHATHPPANTRAPPLPRALHFPLTLAPSTQHILMNRAPRRHTSTLLRPDTLRHTHLDTKRSARVLSPTRSITLALSPVTTLCHTPPSKTLMQNKSARRCQQSDRCHAAGSPRPLGRSYKATRRRLSRVTSPIV